MLTPDQADALTDAILAAITAHRSAARQTAIADQNLTDADARADADAAEIEARDAERAALKAVRALTDYNRP